MASAADVAAFRRTLDGLSGRATADLRRVWANVDPENVAGVRQTLEVVFPALIDAYGGAAAAAGADVFELWADELGVRPRVRVAAGVDPGRANGRMRWAIGQPDPLGCLSVITDELVKQPARSTVTKSSGLSGVRYARVPSGGDTCPWCLMLASRGAVYWSAESAGQVTGRGAPVRAAGTSRQRGRQGKGVRARGSRDMGLKYHGDCRCVAVPVRGPQDYPGGYDPDALYDLFDAGRRIADSGSTKAVVAGMRQITGSVH